MKRILSLCLAALMLCMLSTTAFAATITENGNQSANTTVRYGVESSYTVSIPSNIVLQLDAAAGSATTSISIEDVMIPNDKILTVVLSGASYQDGNWHLTDVANQENQLEYTIMNADTQEKFTNNSVLMQAQPGSANQSMTMSVALNAPATKAGTYTDTITFSVSLKSAISFTIDGVTYQAEDGMTWEQWCNSEYNTAGYNADSGGRVLTADAHAVTTIENTFNTGMVSTADAIVAGYAYYHTTGQLGGAD